MRVIIAGSRDITDYDLVKEAAELSGFQLTEIVSGGQRGVDKLGERFAEDMGLPCVIFEADWAKHGKAAGPIRNEKMADYADALIAIPLPDSRGTTDMIRRARKKGLLVYVHSI